MATSPELVQKLTGKSCAKFSLEGTFQSHPTLCDLVRANLQKQHTRFGVPVSVEERVGLALWRLATRNSYRSCGLQFGLGKSTAKIICSEFEQAVFDLKDRFITFPLTNEEIGEKIEEFGELYRK